MSSILRTFSQIPVRAKYLLVTADSAAVSSGDASEVSAFTLTPGAFISVTSVATITDVEDATGYDTAIAGELTNGGLYKDLGRQITIYNPADHTHLAVFRQVQAVDGTGSEGVGIAGTTPESYFANIFVKVWGADGLGVVVVRTA